MKDVKFAKRWRWPLSDAAYEQYQPGDALTISDDRAAAAEKAGVLDGAPAEPQAEKPVTKTKG